MIRTIPLLFAAIASLAVAACGSGATSEVVAISGEKPNPIFYEISNSLGRTEGWMLGTIHALPDDTEWQTPAIRKAIEDADRAVVEVVDLTNSQGLAETFVRLGTSPEQGSLSLRVAREYREPLDEMVEQSEFSQAQFYDTETWAAAIMLARLGAVGKPRNGVDRYVISQFRDRQVYGFELAHEQLGIFDRLAEQDQRELLEGTVQEWQASRDNPGQLTKAWFAGDEAALLEVTETGIMADPEIRDALLVQRNKDWLPIILKHLDDPGRPLIAVGTAHLVGPDGLKTMLEGEGYTVTRVTN